MGELQNNAVKGPDDFWGDIQSHQVDAEKDFISPRKQHLQHRRLAEVPEFVVEAQTDTRHGKGGREPKDLGMHEEDDEPESRQQDGPAYGWDGEFVQQQVNPVPKKLWTFAVHDDVQSPPRGFGDDDDEPQHRSQKPVKHRNGGFTNQSADIDSLIADIDDLEDGVVTAMPCHLRF